MAQLVLIVEDDALIATSLTRALVANGYAAESTGTVQAAILALKARPPDLVLLDLGLPDGDGTLVALHVARTIPWVPVIVLTARTDETDVVHGLESGAVDYVIKPFHLSELLARIASHLRMKEIVQHDQGSPIADVHCFVAGDLRIDAAARSVTIDGSPVPLRPKEFDVLIFLARHAGTVVTREQLIDEVWDENWWGPTKTLDVHINGIRRRLGENAGEPSRITTVRTVGYRLEGHRVAR